MWVHFLREQVVDAYVQLGTALVGSHLFKGDIMNRLTVSAVTEKYREDDTPALPSLVDSSQVQSHLIPGMVIGAIIGFGIGVGQLVYIGSWDLFYWPYMPMIPIYSALGWLLFGMIVGGSGIGGTLKAAAADRVSREAGIQANDWRHGTAGGTRRPTA